MAGIGNLLRKHLTRTNDVKALTYLDHLVAQVTADLQDKIEVSGARVQYGSLPQVQANEWLLQLFQNLIGNAIKFRSERPAVITITAREELAYWSFTVADTGIGMNMEQARQIFEPLKRLHAQHEYLATCQRIVEGYRARIWVESESGKGSAFHFTLAQQQ